MIYNRIVTLFP